MKSKKRQAKSFKKFIYFCLAIIFLESSAYFLKTYSSPPSTLAQTPVESTNTSNTDISQQPSTLNPSPFTLPILIYHYVEDVKDQRDTIRKSLNIQPSTFETQIGSLKEAGYTFINPSDIGPIDKGEKIIEKPIIISFDDGYQDFYTDVFPILEKHQIKAVAYIVPGFLGQKNYMDWQEVKEISKSSFVEIGAHTMHHLSLKGLSPDAVESEIKNSKLVLELSLGRPVTTFAYPYGHFDDQAVNIVKSAGFTSALTTDTGINDNLSDKFTLHRIHPAGRIGSDLLSAIN